MSANFKVGDHVFWMTAEHGHLPCVVLRLGRSVIKGRVTRLLVSAHDGHQKWAWASHCKLQSEA